MNSIPDGFKPDVSILRMKAADITSASVTPLTDKSGIRKLSEIAQSTLPKVETQPGIYLSLSDKTIRFNPREVQRAAFLTAFERDSGGSIVLTPKNPVVAEKMNFLAEMFESDIQDALVDVGDEFSEASFARDLHVFKEKGGTFLDFLNHLKQNPIYAKAVNEVIESVMGKFESLSLDKRMLHRYNTFLKNEINRHKYQALEQHTTPEMISDFFRTHIVNPARNLSPSKGNPALETTVTSLTDSDDDRDSSIPVITPINSARTKSAGKADFEALLANELPVVRKQVDLFVKQLVDFQDNIQDETNSVHMEHLHVAYGLFMDLPTDIRRHLGDLLQKADIHQTTMKQLLARAEFPDEHFKSMGRPKPNKLPAYWTSLKNDMETVAKSIKTDTTYTVHETTMNKMNAAAMATGLKVADTSPWSLKGVFKSIIQFFGLSQREPYEPIIKLEQKGKVLEYRSEDVAQAAIKHAFATAPLPRDNKGNVNFDDVSLIAKKVDGSKTSPLIGNRKRDALREMLHDTVQLKTAIAVTVDRVAHKIALEQIKTHPINPVTGLPLSFLQVETIAKNELNKFMPDGSVLDNLHFGKTNPSMIRQGSINFVEHALQDPANAKYAQFGIAEAFKTALLQGDTLNALKDSFVGPLSQQENAFNNKYREILQQNLEKYDDPEPGTSEYQHLLDFISAKPEYMIFERTTPEARATVTDGVRGESIQDSIAKRVAFFASKDITKVDFANRPSRAGILALVTGEGSVNPHKDADKIRKDSKALQQKNNAPARALQASVEGITLENGIAVTDRQPGDLRMKSVITDKSIGGVLYPQLPFGGFLTHFVKPSGTFPRILQNFIERSQQTMLDPATKAKLLAEAKYLAKYADDSISIIEKQLSSTSADAHEYDPQVDKLLSTLKNQSKLLHAADKQWDQNISKLNSEYNDSAFVRKLLNGDAEALQDEDRILEIVEKHSESGLYDFSLTKQLYSYFAKRVADTRTKVEKDPHGPQIQFEILSKLEALQDKFQKMISEREFANAFAESLEVANFATDSTPIWRQRVGKTWTYQSSDVQPAGKGWEELPFAKKAIMAQRLINKWIVPSKVDTQDPFTKDVQQMSSRIPYADGKLFLTSSGGFTTELDKVLKTVEGSNIAFKTSKSLDDQLSKTLTVSSYLRANYAKHGMDETTMRAYSGRLNTAIERLAEIAKAKSPEFALDRRAAQDAKNFAEVFYKSFSENLPIWKQTVGTAIRYQASAEKPKDPSWGKMELSEALAHLSQITHDYVTADLIDENDPVARTILEAAASVATLVTDKSGKLDIMYKPIDLSELDPTSFNDHIQLHKVLDQFEQLAVRFEQFVPSNIQQTESAMKTVLAVQVFLKQLHQNIPTDQVEKFTDRLDVVMKTLQFKAPILRERENQFNAEFESQMKSADGVRFYFDPSTNKAKLTDKNNAKTASLSDATTAVDQLLQRAKSLSDAIEKSKTGQAAQDSTIDSNKLSKKPIDQIPKAFLEDIRKIAKSEFAERMYYDPIESQIVSLTPQAAAEKGLTEASVALSNQLKQIQQLKNLDRLGLTSEDTFVNLQQAELDLANLKETIQEMVFSTYSEGSSELRAQAKLVLDMIELADSSIGSDAPLTFNTTSSGGNWKDKFVQSLGRIQYAIMDQDASETARAKEIALELANYGNVNFNDAANKFVNLDSLHRLAFADTLVKNNVNQETIETFLKTLKANLRRSYEGIEKDFFNDILFEKNMAVTKLNQLDRDVEALEKSLKTILDAQNKTFAQLDEVFTKINKAASLKEIRAVVTPFPDVLKTFDRLSTPLREEIQQLEKERTTLEKVNKDLADQFLKVKTSNPEEASKLQAAIKIVKDQLGEIVKDIAEKDEKQLAAEPDRKLQAQTLNGKKELDSAVIELREQIKNELQYAILNRNVTIHDNTFASVSRDLALDHFASKHGVDKEVLEQHLRTRERALKGVDPQDVTLTEEWDNARKWFNSHKIDPELFDRQLLKLIYNRQVVQEHPKFKEKLIELAPHNEPPTAYMDKGQRREIALDRATARNANPLLKELAGLKNLVREEEAKKKDVRISTATGDIQPGLANKELNALLATDDKIEDLKKALVHIDQASSLKDLQEIANEFPDIPKLFQSIAAKLKENVVKLDAESDALVKAIAKLADMKVKATNHVDSDRLGMAIDFLKKQQTEIGKEIEQHSIQAKESLKDAILRGTSLERTESEKGRSMDISDMVWGASDRASARSEHDNGYLAKISEEQGFFFPENVGGGSSIASHSSKLEEANKQILMAKDQLFSSLNRPSNTRKEVYAQYQLAQELTKIIDNIAKTGLILPEDTAREKEALELKLAQIKAKAISMMFGDDSKVQHLLNALQTAPEQLHSQFIYDFISLPQETRKNFGNHLIQNHIDNKVVHTFINQINSLTVSDPIIKAWASGEANSVEEQAEISEHLVKELHAAAKHISGVFSEAQKVNSEFNKKLEESLKEINKLRADLTPTTTKIARSPEEIGKLIEKIPTEIAETAETRENIEKSQAKIDASREAIAKLNQTIITLTPAETLTKIPAKIGEILAQLPEGDAIVKKMQPLLKEPELIQAEQDLLQNTIDGLMERLEAVSAKPIESNQIKQELSTLQMHQKMVQEQLKNVYLELVEKTKEEVSRAAWRARPDIREFVQQNLAKEIALTTVAETAGVSIFELGENLDIRRQVLAGNSDPLIQRQNANEVDKWFRTHKIDPKSYDIILERLLKNPKQLEKHSEFAERLEERVNISYNLTKAPKLNYVDKDMRMNMAIEREEVRKGLPQVTRLNTLSKLLNTWYSDPASLQLRVPKKPVNKFSKFISEMMEGPAPKLTPVVIVGKDHRSELNVTEPMTLDQFREFRSNPGSLDVISTKFKNSRDVGKDSTQMGIDLASYAFVKAELGKPQAPAIMRFLRAQEEILANKLLQTPSKPKPTFAIMPERVSISAAAAAAAAANEPSVVTETPKPTAAAYGHAPKQTIIAKPAVSKPETTKTPHKAQTLGDKLTESNRNLEEVLDLPSVEDLTDGVESPRSTLNESDVKRLSIEEFEASEEFDSIELPTPPQAPPARPSAPVRVPFTPRVDYPESHVKSAADDFEQHQKVLPPVPQETRKKQSTVEGQPLLPLEPYETAKLKGGQPQAHSPKSRGGGSLGTPFDIEGRKPTKEELAVSPKHVTPTATNKTVPTTAAAAPTPIASTAAATPAAPVVKKPRVEPAPADSLIKLGMQKNKAKFNFNMIKSGKKITLEQYYGHQEKMATIRNSLLEKLPGEEHADMQSLRKEINQFLANTTELLEKNKQATLEGMKIDKLLSELNRRTKIDIAPKKITEFKTNFAVTLILAEELNKRISQTGQTKLSSSDLKKLSTALSDLQKIMTKIGGMKPEEGLATNDKETALQILRSIENAFSSAIKASSSK